MMARWMAFLIALAFAISVTYASSNYHSDTIPAIFGIEFNLGGLACSVALPNGTTVGLARVDGNRDYLELIHHYFDLCGTVAKTHHAPAEFK